MAYSATSLSARPKARMADATSLRAAARAARTSTTSNAVGKAGAGDRERDAIRCSAGRSGARVSMLCSGCGSDAFGEGLVTVHCDAPFIANRGDARITNHTMEREMKSAELVRRRRSCLAAHARHVLMRKVGMPRELEPFDVLLQSRCCLALLQRSREWDVEKRLRVENGRVVRFPQVHRAAAASRVDHEGVGVAAASNPHAVRRIAVLRVLPREPIGVVFRERFEVTERAELHPALPRVPSRLLVGFSIALTERDHPDDDRDDGDKNPPLFVHGPSTILHAGSRRSFRERTLADRP